MKNSKGFSSPKIKRLGDDIINNFANFLKKEKEKDKIKFESLLQSQEFNSILKEILTHSYKKPNEIYILNTYLRSLEKFMNIVKFDENETVIENFLSKISSNLQSLLLEQNNMLMRIGEQGDYFYIILSGSVSVLVTKIISIYMSLEQYIEQLKTFYNNEPYLFEGTIKLNKKSTYYVNLDEIKIKDKNYILDGKNKPKSLDEYLSYMNGEKFTDSSSQYYDEVKLMCYFKVTELTQGNSFGEIALIDSKQKRTASIYVNENSFFGKLSAQAYKKSMKRIQEQIKRENIEFVFSTQLFNQISLKFFSQSYWNYFINRRISKGDFLFKKGFERDEIYFIQEGEIKIKTSLNFEKIDLIINNLMPKYKIEKDKNIFDKENDIVICYGKKGHILGMGDLLYKNRFFCDAICESMNANFFAIDINVFLSMGKNFTDVINAFKQLENNKKKIMIRRLKSIKYSYKNSLLGEQYIENGIITKSGKEIKFDDWFDYDKNFFPKSCDCKRKKVVVNINKIRTRNILSPFRIRNNSNNKSIKKENIKNSFNSFYKEKYNSDSDSDLNKKYMIINLKKGQSLNPSLIKFSSKNPKLLNNNNSYKFHNNTYSMNIYQSIKKNKIYKHSRNSFSNDQIIQNIIFAEDKIVSKMLKREKKIYLNIQKKIDFDNNKNYNSISKKYQKLLFLPNRINSGIKPKYNISFLSVKRNLTQYKITNLKKK